MIQNILGAIGCAMDVISAIILAISLDFSVIPSMLGFFIAGIGMVLFRQVSPVSIPTEQILLIHRFSKDRNERASMVLYAGALIFVLGITGLIGTTMDFVGTTILSAVMAGVGIMLFRISIDMVREDVLPAILSIATAFPVYLISKNLIYTVIACILLSTVVWNIVNREKIRAKQSPDLSKEKFQLIKLKFNSKVLRGSLALFTLMLGGIISDGMLTAKLAGINGSPDSMSLYVGLANIFSGLFGGTSLGTIISGTGSAPDPLLSGVLVMGIIVVLLAFKVIPRVSRFIPSQSLAGFLCVLGSLVVFPENAATALSASPAIASVAMLVTAILDPFLGMCAGILMRLLLSLFGFVI